MCQASITLLQEHRPRAPARRAGGVEQCNTKARLAHWHKQPKTLVCCASSRPPVCTWELASGPDWKLVLELSQQIQTKETVPDMSKWPVTRCILRKRAW
mmetsp:Transcript_14250/g.40566  ORF Transcript_14250/g.40566 Transcript_14250/m.40566 type:complete len:99 (-) Transcript_14250:371-667(-)